MFEIMKFINEYSLFIILGSILSTLIGVISMSFVRKNSYLPIILIMGGVLVMGLLALSVAIFESKVEHDIVLIDAGNRDTHATICLLSKFEEDGLDITYKEYFSLVSNCSYGATGF